MRRSRVALTIALAVAAAFGSLSLDVAPAAALPMQQMYQGCIDNGGDWWFLDMGHRMCTFYYNDGSFYGTILDSHGNDVGSCYGDGDVQICDEY